jgi:hypothetical protein
MTQPVAADPAVAKPAGIPARDWIKGCALSLVTVVVLAGATELAARLFFPAIQSTGVGEDCLVLHNGARGVRGVPNCVVFEKPVEGELSDYRFNSSGYRNDRDFAPKQPGTYRIVVLGTSMATGLRVPQEKTFSALLPAELSRRTGRRVELYNLGLPWRSPEAIAQHMGETIALQPDLILWALTPKDVWGTSWEPPVYEAPGKHRHESLWRRIRAALAPKALMARVSAAAGQLRTVTMLRHLLYASPSLYVPSSLKGSDYNDEFLQARSSPGWQQRLAEFDRSAASIEAQSRAAGIPLAGVLIPDRTQVALIAMMGDRPEGLDPYKLDNDLRSIITSHGGTYIDILPDFRSLPSPQKDYMAVDGHPNATAHAEIASFLSSKLASAVPAEPQAGLQPGR